MSRLHHIALLSAFVLFGACRAEYPVDEVDQNIPPPNQEPEFDPDAPVKDIVIKPHDNQSEYYVVAIEGSGPPLGWVAIENPSKNHYEAVRLGNDGTFCANVPLAKDQSNTISFVPFDRTNREGTENIITILQSGTPPDLPATERVGDLENIAKGMGGFHHTVSVDEGNVSELTDESLDAYVLLDNHALRRDYIEFDLSRQADVLSVAIHAEGDCPVESATIFYTNQTSVPLTRYSLEESASSFSYEVKNPEWRVFATLDNTVERLASRNVPADNTAGYSASRIAIEFTSKDCGRLFEGQHKIKEFSAFAAPETSEQSGQTNQQNLCQSGN